MNNQKKLWDKLARMNAKYVVASNKGMHITDKEFRDGGDSDFMKYIFEDKEINIGGTVLEIGCGNGRMTEFIAEVFPKVIAIDVSGVMIEKAKERLKEVDNIEWIETDGENIPIGDESVDFIFSYLVFQHMKEKRTVEINLYEAYRVLKYGGLFKVNVRLDKVDIEKTWWGGVNYSKSDISKLVKKIGFNLLKVEPIGNYGLWLWLKK